MIQRLIYLIDKEINSIRDRVLSGSMNEVEYKTAIAKIDALKYAIDLAKKVETSSEEEEFESDFEV